MIGMTEPFTGLFTPGMVTHETYRSTGDGRTLAFAGGSRAEGGALDDHARPAHAGRRSVVSIKMSKSKKNVVDPDPIIDRYGADAVRWFMLSDSPPERDLAVERGRHRGRVALRPSAVAPARRSPARRAEGEDKALDRKLHQTIAGCGGGCRGALVQQGGGASSTSSTNAIEKAAPSAGRTAAIRALPLLVAPMMPHLAEEAWV